MLREYRKRLLKILNDLLDGKVVEFKTPYDWGYCKGHKVYSFQLVGGKVMQAGTKSLAHLKIDDLIKLSDYELS